MPTKLELMDAYSDVAEDKQSKNRFAEAAKEYKEALHFYMQHAKDNNLSVDAKTGAYSRTNESTDDEKMFNKAYKLHFNLGQCNKELKQYDEALQNIKAAYSYKANSYKVNALLIEIKLKLPNLLKEVEQDLIKIINGFQIDNFQLFEHTLELARVQFQMKKYPAAADSIKELLERLSDYSKDWQAQNNANRLYPYFIAAHNLEGDIHSACQHNQLAKTSYSKAEEFRRMLDKSEKQSAENSDEDSESEMDTKPNNHSNSSSNSMKVS